MRSKQEEKNTTAPQPHSQDVEYSQCGVCFEDYYNEKGGSFVCLSGCSHALCSNCAPKVAKNDCPFCRKGFQPKKNISHDAIKGIFAAAKLECETLRERVTDKEDQLQLLITKNHSLEERLSHLTAEHEQLKIHASNITQENERLNGMVNQDAAAILKSLASIPTVELQKERDLLKTTLNAERKKIAEQNAEIEHLKSKNQDLLEQQAKLQAASDAFRSISTKQVQDNLDLREQVLAILRGKNAKEREYSQENIEIKKILDISTNEFADKAEMNTRMMIKKCFVSLDQEETPADQKLQDIQKMQTEHEPIIESISALTHDAHATSDETTLATAISSGSDTESRSALASSMSDQQLLTSAKHLGFSSSEQKEIALTEDVCQEFLKFFDPKNNKTEKEFLQFIQNNPGVVNGEIKCQVDDSLIETRALFVAAVCPHALFFDLLLKHGADPNFVIKDASIIYCHWRLDKVYKHSKQSHFDHRDHCSVLEVCYRLWNLDNALSLDREEWAGADFLSQRSNLEKIIASILNSKQLTFVVLHSALLAAYSTDTAERSVSNEEQNFPFTLPLLRKMQEIRKNIDINTHHSNLDLTGAKMAFADMLREKHPSCQKILIELLIKTYPQLLALELEQLDGLRPILYCGVHQKFTELMIFDELGIPNLCIDLHCSSSRTFQLHHGNKVIEWFADDGMLPLPNLIRYKRLLITSQLPLPPKINQIISFFIKKMNNINATESIKSLGMKGETALTWACRSRDLETIQALLSERGHDIQGVKEAMKELKDHMASRKNGITSTKNKKKAQPVLDLMQKHIERQKAENFSNQLVGSVNEEKADFPIQHCNSHSSSTSSTASSANSGSRNAFFHQVSDGVILTLPSADTNQDPESKRSKAEKKNKAEFFKQSWNGQNSSDVNAASHSPFDIAALHIPITPENTNF